MLFLPSNACSFPRPSPTHLAMTDEKADGKDAARTRPSMRAAEIWREMRQRPPPSIWTAPQSLAPPPNPAHQVDAKRAETYFRRVTQPHNINGPPPARWQRISNVIGGVLGVSLTLYCVLFHDFGRDEHVFMPVSAVILRLSCAQTSHHEPACRLSLCTARFDGYSGLTNSTP